MNKCLPDLIIGGASKSGTTALFDMLRQRPEFFLPDKKELHFFSYPSLNKLTSGPGDAHVMAEIPATYAKYLAYFTSKKAGQVAVDVSPSYLFHSSSADEIAARLPEVRVVFILRRPEDKVFSQYVHLLGEGRETLSFEDALAIEPERKRTGYSDMWLYRESGYYADGIVYFQNKLGHERVKVFLFDDLRENPSAVLREICLFVGLDGTQKFQTSNESNVSGRPKSLLLAKLIAPNKLTHLLRRVLPTTLGGAVRRLIRSVNTGSKPMMEPETRAALKREFDADIERVEQLIGRRTMWRSQDKI